MTKAFKPVRFQMDLSVIKKIYSKLHRQEFLKGILQSDLEIIKTTSSVAATQESWMSVIMPSSLASAVAKSQRVRLVFCSISRAEVATPPALEALPDWCR